MACRDRSTTPGAVAWIRFRTEASCSSPREGSFPLFRENWLVTTVLATTTSGTTSNAQYVYQLPVKVRNRQFAYALNGWQISGTMFWHSGVPFSVLSTPYSANGNGIVQGSGPQFASVVLGAPLYEHHPIPGVTQPGTIQWLNPGAFASAVDPSTGAVLWWRRLAALPIRKPRSQRPARS